MLDARRVVAAQGSTGALVAPLVGLVGAVLTASFAFLAAWRWPVLGRRLREHVELLKDMPAGHGDALLHLVDKEIEKYVRREVEWLVVPFAAFFYARRTVSALAVADLVALLVIWRIDNVPMGLKPGLVVAGAIAGVLALIFLGLRRWLLWRKRRELCPTSGSDSGILNYLEAPRPGDTRPSNDPGGA